MNVSDITGYVVTFANACGNKLGVSEIIYVQQDTFDHTCCVADAYQAQLDGVPVPYSATHIMISIDTSYGELPQGVLMAFDDSTDNESASNAQLRAITASSRFATRPGIWTLLTICLTSLVLP